MVSQLKLALVTVVVAILSKNKATTSAETPPTASTSYGQVKGSWNNEVAVFTRIPFAAKPIGDLRFEPPQDPERWDGILDGSQGYADVCPQAKSWYGPGTEDCLYLNVLTPNVTSNPLLPVMVWIFGGSYIFGTPSAFPLDGIAKNLASRGVVIVNMNYRLNALGFFTTYSKDFPGNLGMLDQVKALKWVQSEIRNFGGDPTRVTIFGESAGSSSVSLLTYSPLAKGLFKQAIMESGTVYTLWAWNGVRNHYMYSSQEFAVYLNCITNEQWANKQFESLGACLKNKTVDEILDAALNHVSQPTVGWVSAWNPVIGPFTDLLPASLDELRQQRDPISVVMGSCHDESVDGCVFADNHNCSSINKDSFEQLVQQIFSDDVYGKLKDPLATVARFYYGNKKFQQTDDSMAWLYNNIHLMSDYAINFGVVQEAQLLLQQNATVYLYSFDYVSSQASWYPYFKVVPHAYERQFQFASIANQTDDDKKIIELMGRLLTNFAKSGDPNQPADIGLEWASISSNNPTSYLSISTAPEMMNQYHWDAYQLFGSTFDNLESGIDALVNSESTTSTATSVQSKIKSQSMTTMASMVLLFIGFLSIFC